LIYERLASSRFVKLPLGPILGFAILVSAWVMIFTPVGGALIGKNRYDIVVWAFLFGATCIWQALWPSWLLSSRAFQYCGERSYSIYLVHAVTVFRLAPFYAVVYTAFGNTMTSFLVSATIALVAVLCATAIAYELVERPGMRWGAAIIAKHWPR
jgi:peptidoglycan/LPS O-acetylase OafA/YrhL